MYQLIRKKISKYFRVRSELPDFFKNYFLKLDELYVYIYAMKR